jgi:hypothetical protein
VLHPVLAVIGGSGVNVGASFLPDDRGASRSFLAIAMSCSLLVVPFYTEAPSVFLGVHATILGLQLMRIVEIVQAPNRYSRAVRAARVFFLFETDLMKRVPRSSGLGMLALGILFACVSIGGFFLAGRVAPPTTPYALAGWPRWLITMTGGYFFLEGFGRIFVAPLYVIGWEHPLFQRAPIRSRTLAEFWGVRWNHIVARSLKTIGYDPLARRRAPRLGVLAAFGVSGLLHAYMSLAAVGLLAALWMGSFFLIHGLLSILEARLGVRRWGRLASRVFVFGVFLVTIPLFAEPFLRGFGL